MLYYHQHHRQSIILSMLGMSLLFSVLALVRHSCPMRVGSFTCFPEVVNFLRRAGFIAT